MPAWRENPENIRRLTNDNGRHESPRRQSLREASGSAAAEPAIGGRRRAGMASGHAVRPRLPLFFVIPLILVVIVSFWDYNDYEMLPAFTTRSYTETFEGCLDQLPDLCTILKTYLSTAKFCFIVWAHDARHRLHRRLFPRLSRPLGDHADGAVSRLHHSVLDLERHPHDLVDPAARPQRARQPRADARPCRRQAGRMAALFAVLGGARLRPPLHLLHGGADLQFDDAHRQAAHRSGLRFRRVRLADAVESDRARCPSPASSSARSSSSPS